MRWHCSKINKISVENGSKLYLRGTAKTGWWIERRRGNVGMQISPLFTPEQGDTRIALIDACIRHYGLQPEIKR